MTKYIIGASLLLITLIGGCCSCTRIDAGHEGILVKQYGSERGVQDVAIVTGRVWYTPWSESVYEFPTFIQTLDYAPFAINAKDGSEFTIDPTLSFNIVPGNAPTIFRKYRKEIDDIASTTIYNYVKDAFRLQMNKYTTEQIITNREGFENQVQKTLSEILAKDGFRLEQLTSGLKYPDVIVSAINRKNQAIEDAKRVENELKVAEMSARKKIIEAEADAKANQLRQQTLTPLLVSEKFIEKWDGKTPLYGNAPVMFKNVP